MTHDAELRMLLDERRELERRLEPNVLDDLGVLERSAERRAIQRRIHEIDEELDRLYGYHA